MSKGNERVPIWYSTLKVKPYFAEIVKPSVQTALLTLIDLIGRIQMSLC